MVIVTVPWHLHCALETNTFLPLAIFFKRPRYFLLLMFVM